MRAAWWWVDRWRKSTGYTDLSAEAQGVYRNLLDELWLRDGVLPKDEKILRKIGGDWEAWDRVRVVVLARFYETADGLRNATHDEVATRSVLQAEKGKKRAADARREGGKFKAERTPAEAPAEVPAESQPDEPAENQPPSPSPSPSQDQDQDQDPFSEESPSVVVRKGPEYSIDAPDAWGPLHAQAKAGLEAAIEEGTLVTGQDGATLLSILGAQSPETAPSSQAGVLLLVDTADKVRNYVASRKRPSLALGDTGESDAARRIESIESRMRRIA